MLKIYGVPISVHARKVLVTAYVKKIENENDPVIPFNPPPDWVSLSPTGLIPAIADDGFTLSDSNAICAYLDRIQPDPPLYPEDARALGKALWLEQYATIVLFKEAVHPLFFQKIIRPHILQQGEPDEREISRVTNETIPRVFGYLERQVSEGAIGGNQLNIADIAITSNLMNYNYLGFRIDTARYSGLAEAFFRILSLPALQTALEREAPFAEQMGLDRSFTD